MEEGGHYYTVYYTSLAVGFNEEIAFRHAVLSQMPDEVLWMDAAHMQTQECKGHFGISKIDLGKETDFNGVLRYVPADERYRVQYGLHSLPGRTLNERTRSSAYQRSMTTQMLSRESAVSLRFGLLLHRLGDTYAHSRMGHEETMYTVTETDKCFTSGHYTESFGHLFDVHDPDYPFLRQTLFYSYVENLYQVLFDKLSEPASAAYRRAGARPRPLNQVKNDFRDMFMQLSARANREEKQLQEQIDAATAYSGGYPVKAPPTPSETRAKWFIQEIRNASINRLHITMKKYSPENEEGRPVPQFRQFLQSDPDLRRLNIRINDNQSFSDILDDMIPPNGNNGASGSW